MREWLSGGVSPCQGEGRGFESRLALLRESHFVIFPFVFLPQILNLPVHFAIVLEEVHHIAEGPENRFRTGLSTG